MAVLQQQFEAGFDAVLKKRQGVDTLVDYISNPRIMERFRVSTGNMA